MDKEFIAIRKIVHDTGQGKPTIKQDNIRISDIKSFRPWHKKDGDSEIEGDILVLTMKESKESTIKIAESEADFTTRLGGRVIGHGSTV